MWLIEVETTLFTTPAIVSYIMAFRIGKRYNLATCCPQYCSVMMISATVISTVVVLAFVLVHSACGIVSNNCVNSFSKFEKATIAENADNIDSLVHAFYAANSVFPLSVEMVYHVNSSNGTDNIISTDPYCPTGKERWLWVPSPVFIFIPPTRLNFYALYTLNYFQDWEPRRASISVLNVCNVSLNQFNFLSDFTMRVSYLE